MLPIALTRRATSRAVLLLLLTGGCRPLDPVPGRVREAPRGRPADSLLARPELQGLAEATLDRNRRPLIDGLGHEYGHVRARAAYGLASVQDSTAVRALERLLSDPEARVRADVAFALGQTPGGVGPAVTRALVSETDSAVRRLLVEAVGKRGDATALAELRGMRQAELIAPATLALSRGVLREIAPSTTLDLLVGRLTHEDGAVRSAAAYFVARSDPEVWWDRRLDVRRALASYDVDDPAALYLIAGLGRRMETFSRPVVGRFLRRATDWRIRANAAAAIGAERSETGVHLLMLLPALDDPSPHVRLQAATGLAEGGPDPRIVEAVARWVRAHPNDRAPAGALLPLLARVGRSDVVLEHVRGLPAHDIPAWSEAIAALALVEGEEAVRELGRVLADPDVPAPVARQASAVLLDRWELSRPMRETHEAFLDVAEDVVEGPRPRRARELAPMLSDPSLRPRGEALLRRLSERLPRGVARDAPAAEPPERLEVDWESLRRLGPRPRLVLDTDRGTIILRLRTEEAPLTVQAIAALAESGRYDGTPFHRVVPNFVIQGGDVSRGDGGGGPGFVIRSEFTRTPYERGVLGMASSGKDTEGSQFFVTHSPQPHLDGGYTAFGWVERGMEVVDVIVRGDRIVRARVLPGS